MTKSSSSSQQLGFIHRFLQAPATTITSAESTVDNEKNNKLTTLLLLHGTGGNEDDLIPIGRMLAPNASMLSPRGKVLENGMPRFFRRLAEGIFDIKDLKYRTNELADFLQKASQLYNFDLKQTIAIGFSNGANIAASILLLRPKVLSAAILFRPMIPFVPQNMPDLSNVQVLISAGLKDPIVSKEQTEDLFNLLKKAKAKVSLQWQNSGHGISNEDIRTAKEWLLLTSLSSSY